MPRGENLTRDDRARGGENSNSNGSSKDGRTSESQNQGGSKDRGQYNPRMNEDSQESENDMLTE